MRTHRLTIAAMVACCLLGCDAATDTRVAHAQATPGAAQQAQTSICQVVHADQPLPEEVRETSGLAQSRRNPELFWTHNDKGNDPDLYAIDSDGRVVQRVRVTGATLVDWEDIDAGPCATGTCLYVGDIGDNDGARSSVTVYSLPEPAPGADRTTQATAVHARFADGPQDAEALFSLPSGELFLVTKGRRGPVALYRIPEPVRADETVTLELVRELFPEPEASSDRVTAAAASADGHWVGIRTARTLLLYPAAALTDARPVEPIIVDLAPLGEDQGEALVLGNDGSVWLTSEAEDAGMQPRWSRLQCTLP